MKKTLSIILIMLLVIASTVCLISCGETEIDEFTNELPNVSTNGGQSSDGTGTNGNQSNDGTGTNGNQSNDGEIGDNDNSNTSKTDWEMGEFVDEFKLPTGDKYLSYTDYNGQFSNSATTNSELTAILQVTEDWIGIMLFEYGWGSAVKGIFDYEYYDITILDDNRVRHEFDGTLYEDSTRIMFNSVDENKVINLIRNNKTIKIYVSGGKYTTSSYLFEVDCTGFSDIYDATF